MILVAEICLPAARGPGPAPERLVEGGLRRSGSSPRCWSPSTPTTCRSTARRRSSPGRGSSSTARPVRLGRPGLLVARAAVAPAGRHVMSSTQLFADDTRCRCSTPAGAGPRPASSGATRSMTGPGAAAPRRRWSTSTPRTARASGRPPTWPASGRAAGRRLRRVQEPARRPAGRRVRLAFCWAHCRRRFYEIRPGDRLADRRRGAAPDRRALRDRGRDPRPPGRGAARGPAGAQQADRRGPAAWLTAQLGRVSGKSGLAEAIRYALRHWAGLVLFLEDGRLELDTNTVERAIRPIADGTFILPLFFKCLETLELVFAERRDAGRLCARARR